MGISKVREIAANEILQLLDGPVEEAPLESAVTWRWDQQRGCWIPSPSGPSVLNSTLEMGSIHQLGAWDEFIEVFYYFATFPAVLRPPILCQ